MLKDRFSTDDLNRLVITRGKEKIVPDGRFTLSQDNSLVYWLNESPEWRRRLSLPQETKFEGIWKLNDNYDLELHLSQDNRRSPGDKIVLKGEIISTEKDVLAFELYSQDKFGRKEFQILQLSGSWASDGTNAISFLADKKVNPDILKLGVGWKINRDQQIVYTYEKTSLKTKVKDIRVLTFSGFWEINPDNILSYQLSTGSKSRFDFQARIESPNLYPQSGKIKYRLGAGIKESALSGQKVITLCGCWKFGRALSLIFEMDYGRGNVRALEFGTDINLTHKDKVILSLVSGPRQPLGINIIFSHRFLKKLDAEAFLKFKALREDRSVEVGVQIPF